MPPPTFFLLRAIAAAPDLHNKFDHWTSADHLPWAIRMFKWEMAWPSLEFRAGLAL